MSVHTCEKPDRKTLTRIIISSLASKMRNSYYTFADYISKVCLVSLCFYSLSLKCYRDITVLSSLNSVRANTATRNNVFGTATVIPRCLFIFATWTGGHMTNVRLTDT